MPTLVLDDGAVIDRSKNIIQWAVGIPRTLKDAEPGSRLGAGIAVESRDDG